MTTSVATLKARISVVSGRPDPLLWRTLGVATLAATALSVPGGIELAGNALADAYLQVSVFVAGTLLLVSLAEGLFRADLAQVLARHRTWQVPAGALLGAFPGCGGAIVAVTQFTRGNLSFGSVVATLTSTMGDAMFLLLAREPVTAGVVLAISNDGDALFPAIAKAPRAAALATLYTAVPALIVAYGAYALGW